jgi:hypothetical protein
MHHQRLHHLLLLPRILKLRAVTHISSVDRKPLDAASAQTTI